jgi:hypothetical protein
MMALQGTGLIPRPSWPACFQGVPPGFWQLGQKAEWWRKAVEDLWSSGSGRDYGKLQQVTCHTSGAKTRVLSLFF